LELDARIRCQLGLVDLIEEPDAFVANVLLQALDRLCDRKALFTEMMPSLPASADGDAAKANAKRKAEQS
jgi:hypothetical protein